MNRKLTVIVFIFLVSVGVTVASDLVPNHTEVILFEKVKVDIRKGKYNPTPKDNAPWIGKEEDYKNLYDDCFQKLIVDYLFLSPIFSDFFRSHAIKNVVEISLGKSIVPGCTQKNLRFLAKEPRRSSVVWNYIDENLESLYNAYKSMRSNENPNRVIVKKAVFYQLYSRVQNCMPDSSQLSEADSVLIDIIKVIKEKENGENFLHYVCSRGDLNMVKFLVSQGGFDINETTRDGGTLLHRASRSGNFHIVQYLLENGAQPNMKNCIGQFPVHVACEFGHPEILKLFLDHDACDISVKDEKGWTVFHYACYGAKFDIIKLLIEKYKEGVNDQDNWGWTPLHIALLLGYFEGAKYLIDQGADKNIAAHNGKTPIDYLLPGMRDEIATYGNSFEDEESDQTINFEISDETQVGNANKTKTMTYFIAGGTAFVIGGVLFYFFMKKLRQGLQKA